MDITAIAINLISVAERFGYASAVDLLEGHIEGTLPVGTEITVLVMLNGADAEDVQEWLDRNE